MACGSCGQRRPGQRAVPTRITTSAGTSRTLYQVVLTSGAVAFQTNNVDLARKVQSNYPGSRLEPDPDAAAASVVVPLEEEPAPAARTSTRKTKAAAPVGDDVTEVTAAE